ncbi:hypothetical protein J23TS9_14660 [Paenibacillus sp. J23TS9]|uniref:DUF6596 domain-containing protein n=1 Tax=Paenibacillus sp. J23TS9 TaxID=2807193 RepID=UPI001AFF6557|nr:DUF6596 domain-containing protein [Paenibacillus sp. J23TS9]GIP26336.1 hypothetical protein J23TS9_14660 [Paenibacillus sp. J23TS9]
MVAICEGIGLRSGERLTRAKAKIRAERLTFEMQEIPDRLDSVLEAIYAAYGSGWDEAAMADSPRRRLAEEAIYLGRLLLQLAPRKPEVYGLLATIASGLNHRCFCPAISKPSGFRDINKCGIEKMSPKGTLLGCLKLAVTDIEGTHRPTQDDKVLLRLDDPHS